MIQTCTTAQLKTSRSGRFHRWCHAGFPKKYDDSSVRASPHPPTPLATSSWSYNVFAKIDISLLLIGRMFCHTSLTPTYWWNVKERECGMKNMGDRFNALLQHAARIDVTGAWESCVLIRDMISCTKTDRRPPLVRRRHLFLSGEKKRIGTVYVTPCAVLLGTFSRIRIVWRVV